MATAPVEALDRREQLTRIEKMVNEIQLNQSQVKEVGREFVILPISVAVTAIAASGALLAAGAALAKLFTS